MPHVYLVTGGAGFIGSNLVHHLLEERPNAVVVVYDALTYAGNLDNLEAIIDGERCHFVEGNICDPNRVADTFAAHRPTVVFNLAAESHVDRSIDGPAAFVQTNVVGTFEMLDAARSYVKTLDEDEQQAFRFVHVSTDEVYGSLGAEGLFHETTPYAPNSPYAASKAAADHLARAYHVTYGLPTITTNCSNNYGPYQFPEKLIPVVILNALEGRPLPVYGDGANIRDWIFVGDHCEALVLAAERGTPGETYNVGASEERTTLQMVHAVCDALDELAPARAREATAKLGSYRELIEFVTDRPGHDLRYAIDATKVCSQLGWKPSTSFAEGMKRTVRWYLDHQGWCQRIADGGYRRERLGLEGEKA
ncbi:MAG: dTDP-glucose 4,6-dehydratase [Deltaproteobacteria bacterium]|jgi:dTDP-glucose 4,6-dehydratase|nr:dTDP-glucose 4,6-dehydratase [Deltaproteobacteria bacterium]MBW2536769.1 dTDP-glucose 4,6-dehydratase [Deltaproteobacteria bacterium]